MPRRPRREQHPARTPWLRDERSLGLFVVRVVVGVVSIGHGSPKLFGALHGSGISGTATFFEPAGHSPGRPIAAPAGLVEFGGGILLVLGLATSAAAGSRSTRSWCVSRMR